MTDRQRKILSDALTAMSAAAQRGKRMLADGASLTEVAAHLEQLSALARQTHEAIEFSAGAGAVLERARAKTIARPRLPR